MKRIKQISALMLALVMMLSLSACGSFRSVSQKDSSVSATMPTPAPMVAPAAGMAADYDVFYAEEEMGLVDSGFSTVSTAAANSVSQNTSASSTETQPENPDKIIYSSDVTVETTKFDETIGKVSTMVERYGAWIESSSVSGSNYYQTSRGNAAMRSASYTLRVPSGRFRELMDNLSDLGNIPYSHIYTENVTSQYYDAQAHLKAYTTQENRLLEMMELAESVEDVIIIEDRLTELRYQIEALQSRLNNWDRRVSYSTVSLSVQEVREYTPEEKINPTFGEELSKALKDGLYNAGQFLKDLLVTIVEILPVLLILILILLLVIWLIRKLIRGIKKRRARKAEKKAAALKQEKPAPEKTE